MTAFWSSIPAPPLTPSGPGCAARNGLDNVEVRQLDLLDLDRSDCFDAVIAANVLHLLPDPDAALTAMVGALRPGGRLLVNLLL